MMMSEPYHSDKDISNLSKTTGHSRLLKYLIPSKMADLKFKFDYTEPENVKSEVPGEQKLREDDASSSIDKPVDKDGDTIEDPENYVLSPVVTVTKQETTLTKGDLKLQKVSVTENISIRNGVFHTIKPPSYPQIYSEVIPDSPIRSMDHSSQSDDINLDSRPIRSLETQISQTSRRIRGAETQAGQSGERRTRIPTRFKNAVNRVRRERSMPAKKIEETLPTHPRRSSIPRLKTQISSTKPDEEFDRLFDEIVTTPIDIDVSLLNNKVEDPEQVEDCFEEIIHAYDENQLQPIEVVPKPVVKDNKTQHVPNEKPRQSRIPMLKRKSEAEIEVPKNLLDRKASLPGDKNKVQNAVAKLSKVETNETKIPTKSAVTKKLSYDGDNVKLRASYQRIKSISKDGQKQQEIQIKNVVKMSMEQDISPDNVINISSVQTNETRGSTVEIVEITPLVETVDIANEIVIQPYSVELVESPNDTTENSVIEVEEVSENGLAPKENEAVTSEYNVDPVKVVSVDEFQTLIRTSLKENENRNAVLEINRNDIINNTSPSNEAKGNNNIEPEFEVATTKMEEKRPFVRTISHDSNKTEDTENKLTQFKSVLSKIAMFEQSRQDRSPIGIKPKPSVRCAYKLRREENTTKEPEKRTPEINKDASDSDEVKPELPSTPPPNLTRNISIDNTPVIVSELIKPVESSSYAYNIITESYYPVDVETISLEVNNNVTTSVSKIDVKSEDVAVFEVAEENIIEEEALVKENEEIIFSTGIERVKRHHPHRYYSFEVDYSQEKPITVEKASEFEISILKPIEIEYTESTTNGDVNETKEQKVIIKQVETKSKSEDPRNPFNFTPKTPVRKNKFETMMSSEEILNAYKARSEDYNMKKAKSVAELDLYAVKGKVQDMIVRMKSVEKSAEKKPAISVKERPRKKSVSEKIALFEGFVTQTVARNVHTRPLLKEPPPAQESPAKDYETLLHEIRTARQTYGQTEKMATMALSNGVKMPVMAIGTALLDNIMASTIVATAIDLGYRAIDTAYIYGNEKEVGEGIKKKIEDGTVQRSDLFVISKLWSTFHRRDLVEKACRQSLENLGLEYADLYLIHNPMSFKEGPDPVPMIAKVVQYSDHDFLDAWYGMEDLVTKGLVKSIGLSNFNSSQVQRILEKARIPPVVNQVECHPYLSQQRLYNFCDERKIKLSCFGVLGSKGTPAEYKNSTVAAIDDPLVQVMAAGLNVTPAQLLIRYQLQSDHAVVVKASSGAHLWDNLQALKFDLTEAQMDALRALNRNKRTFTFKGMGDTHKNYPFNAPF